MRMLHAAYTYADVCVCYLQLDARQPPAPRRAQGLRRLRQEGAPGTVHAACSIRIRQHTHTLHVAYAYVSIRQEGAPSTVHAACRLVLSIWQYLVCAMRHLMSQHTSAYVSIRQHTSAYVSLRQHTSILSMCDEASHVTALIILSIC
jgi:hypothetical protein